MNQTYDAPCYTCPKIKACYPIIATDIRAYAEKTLFGLFTIEENPDGYPEFYLIGIYDTISAAGDRISGMYTIIDRETLILNMKSPFRDAIPYDYIIEPIRINQPIKSAYEIACSKYPD